MMQPEEGQSSEHQSGRPTRVPVAPKPYMSPELLIKAVCNKPCLWDESDETYSDRNWRRKAWSDIASLFVGGSPHDLQKTWENMRKALNNQRNAYANKYNVSGGPGAPKYKPYKYEAEMKFLDGVRVKDTMEGNLGDSRVDIIDDEVPVIGQLSARAEEEEMETQSAMDYSISCSLEENAKRVMCLPRSPLKSIPCNVQSFPLKLKPTHSTPIRVESQPTPVDCLENKENFSPVHTEVKPMQPSKQPPNKRGKNDTKLKSQSCQPVESPAAKAARLRREKEVKKADSREEVVKKMEEAVAKAAEEKVKKDQAALKACMKRKDGTLSDPCTCSAAVEAAILEELQKSTDDPVSLFLLSLAEDLRTVPKSEYRVFQQQVLSIMPTNGHIANPPMQACPETRKKRVIHLSVKQQVDAVNALTVGEAEQAAVIDDYVLTGRDLHTLKEGNLLNDMVISAYMRLIQYRNNFLRVYSFNTFFLGQKYDTVKTWCKDFDPSQYDVVLLPAHREREGHWGLFVLHLLPKMAVYCCSMGGGALIAHMTAIEEYFTKKWGISGWTGETAKDMPRQNNSVDCGVYICIYANFVAEGKEVLFTAEDMPHFRQRMVFELVNASLLQL